MLSAFVCLFSISGCQDFDPTSHKGSTDTLGGGKIHEEIVLRYPYDQFESKLIKLGSTVSEVSFLKLQSHWLLENSDKIELDLHLFLKPNGRVDIYSYWIFPNYLKNGARVYETRKSFASFNFIVVDGKIFVSNGDSCILTFHPEEQRLLGEINIMSLEPPQLALKRDWLPEYISIGTHGAMEFVIEPIEADLVDLIFK